MIAEPSQGACAPSRRQPSPFQEISAKLRKKSADSVFKGRTAMNEVAVPNKIITKVEKQELCPSKTL